MTLETFVIHITKKCNMSCLYCYEDDKISTYTWEEIKATIDQIFDGLNEIVSIEFLGGEPMLFPDLVLKAFYYMEEHWAGLVNDYIITTNGSLLNPSIIELISKPKIRYIISLDGSKYSNQLRLLGDNNSYDTIIKNIKIIQGNGYFVGVHMVTHPFNVAWLFDNVKHLFSLGIQSIGIGTVEKTMIIDKEYCDTFLKEMKKVSDFVLDNPNLYIDILDGLKPISDKRTYIRDTNGKVLFETYGRIKKNLNSLDKNMEVLTGSSDVEELIYEIRSKAYFYHQANSFSRGKSKLFLLQSIKEKIDYLYKILEGEKNEYKT